MGTDPTMARPAVALADDGADDPLPPGTRVHQFEVIRELGRGGMGRVLLARDTRLARLVALKFLSVGGDQLVGRFLVEARATARCQHENIVVIYEADEWNRLPYMALEYLEGETLADTAARGPLTASRAVELMVPVVRALARAHEHAIVHCDLKPDNVFVNRDGVIKVLDFGIAQLLAAAAVDGEVAGTMPYMAPEQWGVDTIDHRTDLWAVGIIFWELLTGRHPLEPLTPETLWSAAALLDQPMPSIGSVMPELPAALERAIDRCLAKPKHQRHASALALLAELAPLLPTRAGRRLDSEASPFPGMAAFQEGDADRFFGRETDVTHVVARLHDQPMIGIIAPSGVGKSSFVRAGMIPALRASSDSWDVVVVRPGKQPLTALAAALAQVGPTVEPGGALIDHAALAVRLRAEPGLLGAMLRARARHKRGRLLLFVDQFEELYTLCPHLEERLAFTACLAGVADEPASPLRLVVSMRSDFLDRAAEDRGFADRLTRGLVILPPIGPAGLRAALTEPLEMAGYRFESDQIVDDMVQSLAGAPGALPLLQFTAARLWDTRDRSRRQLTAESYATLGRVGGALATHADHVLAATTTPRQRLIRAVVLRLVTADGTRAVVDRAELEGVGDAAEVRAVIDHLMAARLLVAHSRGDQGPAVELVHESLIASWPALRRWREEIAEDSALLEQLRSTARQWELRGRPAGLLWRGEALDDARAFARRYRGELAPRERGFLDAVIALGARAQRRRRRLVAAGFVILAALVAAATVALVTIRAAEQAAQGQRVTAEHEATRARAAEAEGALQLTTINRQLATIQAETQARTTAEARKQAADASRQEAETGKRQAEAEVAAQRDDLATANHRLERALAAAEGERTRAIDATRRVESTARELETALGRERARVRQLEEEKRRLSTRLK